MSKALFASLPLSFSTVVCLSACPLFAQVTTDGTINTQVNQNGNVAKIMGGETRDSREDLITISFSQQLNIEPQTKIS